MHFSLRHALVLCSLVATMGLPAQQVPAAAPALSLHVKRSTLVWLGNGCYERLFGSIGDLKVELESDKKLDSAFSSVHMPVVEPGDYPITITHDKKTDHGTDREYDVEVSNGKHMGFHLMGVEE